MSQTWSYNSENQVANEWEARIFRYFHVSNGNFSTVSNFLSTFSMERKSNQISRLQG